MTDTTPPTVTAPEADHSTTSGSAHATLAIGLSVLAGCGGGGGGDTTSSPSTGGTTTPPPPNVKQPVPPSPVSSAVASRFLAQASMGASKATIAHAAGVGPAYWIEDQLKMPRQPELKLFDWMLSKGYHTIPKPHNSSAGVDDAIWRSLILGEDTLRQRFALALSEIFVASPTEGQWRNFCGAAYMDLLLDNAFGDYRTLLEKISTNVLMGRYLTFTNNTKGDPAKGSLPDENYARELLQLFSIGLYELNDDGTPKLVNGKPIETYDQSDIMGLARVLTGWKDNPHTPYPWPEKARTPMKQYPPWHETGEKSFLGITIPAGTNGDKSLKLALDAIFNHPNVGPFIGKQLIQRLVTSNPSPAYVRRVTNAFNDNGEGKRGDFAAVIRAILLDTEARNTPTGNTFGKVREPILRFSQWARACGAQSSGDSWKLGGLLSDPASRLGQAPLRSPSVFNFFRPGYVPPNTSIAAQKLVAPEFQITDEVSVAGYLNFMQKTVQSGVGDVVATYADFLPYATDPVSLVIWLNLVLAANRLSAATRKTISDAITTIPANDNAGKKTRVQAAVMLTLASPEFIVLK